ncbi:MAG: hypothetical protein ACLTDR_14725 [Adlercreutzia equolifaciens]
MGHSAQRVNHAMGGAETEMQRLAYPLPRAHRACSTWPCCSCRRRDGRQRNVAVLSIAVMLSWHRHGRL